MFKVGDKIVCVEGYRSYNITLEVGDVLKVLEVFSEWDTVRTKNGTWNSRRFKLFEENTTNPCIVSEVITTTKRKIRDNSSLKMGYNTIFEGIRFHAPGRFVMRGSIYTAAQLREFISQLNEIADVLEEN